MKKSFKIIGGCSILALAVVVGCVSSFAFNNNKKNEVLAANNDSSGLSQTASQENISNDYTISVKETNFTLEQINTAQKVDLNPSFSTSCASTSELCENAEASVECTVLSVSNTIKDGYPYTKYDVEINDVLYGDFNIGDKISVIQIGGYMTIQDEINAYNNEDKFQNISLDARESTLIEKNIADNDYPLAGDRYVLFISKDNLFEGAYYPVNEYEGVFKYDVNSQKWNRNMPEEQSNDLTSVKLDKLKAVCADVK